MSQFLRILLLIIVFIFLFRLLKRFLVSIFNPSNKKENIPPEKRRKNRYDNIEEAKFTDLSENDEQEKKP